MIWVQAAPPGPKVCGKRPRDRIRGTGGAATPCPVFVLRPSAPPCLSLRSCATLPNPPHLFMTLHKALPGRCRGRLVLQTPLHQPPCQTLPPSPCCPAPLNMGMGTLCTAKKPPKHEHGDILHCQKAPYIWAWGHFELPKRPLYMGMGTLCIAKKPP